MNQWLTPVIDAISKRVTKIFADSISGSVGGGDTIIKPTYIFDD